MNRRDVLKTLLLAPVAGLVPGAAVAAPGVLPGKPHPDWSNPVEWRAGYERIPRFTLTLNNAKASVKICGKLLSRFNSDTWKGFPPLTLECVQYRWEGGTNWAQFTFEQRAMPEMISLPSGERFQLHGVTEFAALPDGEFVEIAPRWEAAAILVDRHGNRITNSAGDQLA